MGFEFLDHTADIQVHSWGKSLEEAFEQATYGLMDLMVDTKGVSPEISKEITISAPDKEILLVDYLSEYLSIFDIDELLFSKIKVDKIEFNEKENKFMVHAIAYGEKYNSDKHMLDTEVKAITFSYLKIIENEGKTELYVIFDL